VAICSGYSPLPLGRLLVLLAPPSSRGAKRRGDLSRLPLVSPGKCATPPAIIPACDRLALESSGKSRSANLVWSAVLRRHLVRLPERGATRPS
jgi:hypothetical protein